MRYVIVNRQGIPLSGFDSNDMVTKHQLKFRTRDWYSYSTRKEAQAHLKHIRKECRQKGEANALRIKQAR